jgi:cytochrome b6-f complex iron-sulfur subunit
MNDLIGKITRGEFFKIIFGFFAALWTGMTTYPIFRYLISGTKQAGDDATQVASLYLGKVEDFIPGSSKNFKFGSIPALLVRTEDGQFHAYNATCTHLSCTVQYSGQEKSIWCACHGGRFDPNTGDNISGPPPRPLSKLVVETSLGEIIVSRA